MDKSDRGSHLILGYKGLIGSTIFNIMNQSIGVSRCDYKFSGEPPINYNGNFLCLIESLVKQNDLMYIHYCLGSLVPRNSNYSFEEITFEPSLLFKLSELCSANGIKLIFYSSGGALYSISDRYQEQTEPLSYYRSSKLLSESIVQHKFTDSLTLRISNVYGRADVKKSNGVIDYIARNMNSKLPVHLFGSNTRFDFIHRDNLAQIVKILLNLDETGIYNVGSGHRHTIFQLYTICLKLGYEHGLSFDYKVADIFGDEPDLSKLEKLLIDNNISIDSIGVYEYLSKYVD